MNNSSESNSYYFLDLSCKAGMLLGKAFSLSVVKQINRRGKGKYHDNCEFTLVYQRSA